MKESQTEDGFKLLKKSPDKFYPDNKLTHTIIKAVTEFIMTNTDEELSVKEYDFLYAFEVVKFFFNESIKKKGQEKLGISVEFT